LAIGDVRPVEAPNQEVPPRVNSSLKPLDTQSQKAPRPDTKTPRSGARISKRVIILKIKSLKLMKMLLTNHHLNHLQENLTKEFIKVYNRTIPLTISLGAYKRV